MNIKKYILYFALPLLVFSGCKKEEIEPDVPADEVPVFRVSGAIGSMPVAFDAGVDGAYLTSFTEMVNGVEKFSGKIIQGDNFVEFGIYNGNLFLPSSNILQAGLELGLSNSTLPELFRLNKDLLSNAGSVSDIDISVDGNDAVNELIIYEPGIYEICVKVYFIGSSQATQEICNTVILGYRNHGNFLLQYDSSLLGIAQASVSAMAQVNEVKWYIDEKFVSSGTTLIQPLDIGEHIIAAEVFFSNGVVARREMLVSGKTPNAYFEDIAVFAEPIDTPQYRDFKGHFTIQHNGTSYSHHNADGAAQVIISGISYFGKNGNGNDVYKVTGLVNTKMKNNTTSAILDASFNIAIGIEIP